MTTPLPDARHNTALSTRTGIRRVTRVSLTRGGVTLNAEPISASFTQDARRSQRWNGSMKFADPNLLPTKPSDLLTPFGTQVTVQLGVELSDGTQSVVPNGKYLISSSSGNIEADSATTDVTLVDLSDAVERYRFEEPLTIASGTDLAVMVNAVIASRTGADPGLEDTGRTLGAQRVFGLDTETGPWSELLDVLDSFDMTAWYDRSGVITLGTALPDSDTALPITGALSLSTKFDTRPYNIVVVNGEAIDGTPIHVVAYDDDPSSPTYAGTTIGSSDYGRVTRFYSSKMIYTEEQATATAISLLVKSLGGGASMTLTRAFDPTSDANDVISVLGTNYVVDSATVNVSGKTSQVLRPL